MMDQFLIYLLVYGAGVFTAVGARLLGEYIALRNWPGRDKWADKDTWQ